MKITNKFKFAAITLLLLAGSATQALADDWSAYDLKSNIYNPYSNVTNKKFSDLVDTYNWDGTSWWTKYAGDEPVKGAKGIFAKIKGYTNAGDLFVEMGIFETKREIPAYTKLVRKTNFFLYTIGGAKPVLHGCSIYLFDDLTTAQSTPLDARYGQGLSNQQFAYGDGSSNTLIKAYWGSGNPMTSNAVSRSLTYDNSSKAENQEISKYIVLVQTPATPTTAISDKTSSFSTFYEQDSKDTWYYYKYVTFDPNGGTGTAMAQQTVVDNTATVMYHTLNTNTYKRAGYEFDGWNTKADGSGTAYKDQGMIDASSTDKGPVTLYAQWKPTAWTYTEQVKIGTILIAETANGLSYDSHNPAQSWGGNYVTDVQGSGVTGDQGVMHKGTSILNTSQVSVSIYKQTKNIPAYSKFTRNASFSMYAGSNWAYEACGLYMFDDEFSAKYTILDVYRYQNKSYGDAYKIVKGYMEDASGTHYTWSGSKAITYDNSTGSSDKEISKYIDLVHSSLGNSGSTATCTQWVTWKETNSTEGTWYYYKHFTFKKNDGTDTQVGDVITIENSGTLSFPETPTLTGYKFVGWNTQADGKGTTYTNGQEITATLEDKGPVTLYAQWVVDVTVSESGSATIFADKNLVVPKGVQVYGFVYMDGALVQGAEISEGAILPAYNGYLVKAATAGTYAFALSASAATAPTSDLTGTTAEIDTPSGNVYVWGKPEGYNCGWYKYTGTTIPAGKAYFVAGSINGGINDMNINTNKDF